MKNENSFEELLLKIEEINQWLENSEKHKSRVSKNVFKKVHDEYINRLNLITKELGNKKNEIEIRLNQLIKEVEDLNSNISLNNEKLEEYEFRKLTGEIDKKLFDEKMPEIKIKISQLLEKKEKREKSRKELESILSNTNIKLDKTIVETKIKIPEEKMSPKVLEDIIDTSKVEKQKVNKDSTDPLSAYSDKKIDKIQSFHAPMPKPKKEEEDKKKEFSAKISKPSKEFESTFDNVFDNNVFSDGEEPFNESLFSSESQFNNTIKKKTNTESLDEFFLSNKTKEQSELIKCSKCGAENKANAWNCENCGETL